MDDLTLLTLIGLGLAALWYWSDGDMSSSGPGRALQGIGGQIADTVRDLAAGVTPGAIGGGSMSADPSYDGPYQGGYELSQSPISSGSDSDFGGSGGPDVVARAISDLSAAGIDLQGPCGALAITNLVAWRLRPRYGLLRKAGGNRAIPQSDGSCADGNYVAGDGFATDYLIDRQTFYGYDILNDGGGANGPAWSGPETDFVDRNQSNVADPFDPGI